MLSELNSATVNISVWDYLSPNDSVPEHGINGTTGTLEFAVIAHELKSQQQLQIHVQETTDRQAQILQTVTGTGLTNRKVGDLKRW